MKVEDIKKVGVVGAERERESEGIAISFALWGYPTVLRGINDEIM